MRKKQTEVNAFLNHGRWIWLCPRCHTALEAKEGNVVCGVCWPAARAQALQPIEGGLFRSVPDGALVSGAVKQAEEHGEYYVINFPAERSRIEEIVRHRARIADINWHPGETVADLIEQNKAHGDPLPKGVK